MNKPEMARPEGLAANTMRLNVYNLCNKSKNNDKALLDGVCKTMSVLPAFNWDDESNSAKIERQIRIGLRFQKFAESVQESHLTADFLH
ncbi:MAG: hypothetical protein JAY82_19110 [Candidatus Thiodiazotropha taylori]|nr:hypothetical protein [Candidatus Thiodiazotropha taylori]